MVEQPGRQVAQAMAGVGRVADQRAELFLRPRAAQEQHQALGDVQRRAVTAILLDQSQGQVYARADTRRGIDLAVTRPDRGDIEIDARVTLTKSLFVQPVRRRPLALQKPGLGQDKGASAHRTDTARRGSLAHDPVAQIRRQFEGALNLGQDDQGVDRPVEVTKAGRGGDAEPTGARDLAVGAGRQHHDVIGGPQTVGRLEDFERAEQVQFRQRRYDQEGNGPSLHTRHDEVPYLA